MSRDLFAHMTDRGNQDATEVPSKLVLLILVITKTLLVIHSQKKNVISHVLANYARHSGCIALWLSSGPEDVEDRCIVDCNPYG